VYRRTDTGHTANGGHVTKFQGGDTNGSGCVGLLQAELMHAGKKNHNFTAHYYPAKEYYCIIGLINVAYLFNVNTLG